MSQARRAALQFLRFAAQAGRRQEEAVFSRQFFSESSSRAAFGDSSKVSPVRQHQWWGRVSLGLAAAGAGATFACTAVSASVGQEVIVADGIKITASGGVKVKHQVVFVLGGPGSGKGTQCAKLTEEFNDIAHFSAGDLLREHVKSGTPQGNMVADMIKNGQIVPAEVTVGLLQDAMTKSGKSKILIDGFPRNASNREVFQQVVGYDCALVLFFDCPEEVLEQRLLSRNQGRVDDNIETIKKRFHVFLEQSMPVIEHYSAQGKVRSIDTNRAVDQIYEEVRGYIVELGKANNN